jgi:hypothetical protein
MLVPAGGVEAIADVSLPTIGFVQFPDGDDDEDGPNPLPATCQGKLG